MDYCAAWFRLEVHLPVSKVYAWRRDLKVDLTTIKNKINSILLHLHHQQFWFGQVLFKSTQKESSCRFIHNTTVRTETGRHDGSNLGTLLFLGTIHLRSRHDTSTLTSDGQNGSLWRINDRTEFVNTKHAQIGNAKGSSLIFVRLQLSIPGAAG